MVAYAPKHRHIPIQFQCQFNAFLNSSNNNSAQYPTVAVAGRVNVDLCALLLSLGVRAVGLSVAIRAHKRPPRVVAGAGPAGCAAAIAAARLGAKVLLVEAMGCLGGMSTSGLVSAFDPMANGERMLVGGIMREIVESRRGAEGGYMLARSPESFSVGDVLRAVEGPRHHPAQSPGHRRLQGQVVFFLSQWCLARRPVW